MRLFMGSGSMTAVLMEIFMGLQELIAQALPEKIANWQSKLDGVKESMQVMRSTLWLTHLCG